MKLELLKNEDEFDDDFSEDNNFNSTNPSKLNSWTEFIMHLNELINGMYIPQFTQNITCKLHDGQVLHLTCSVIAMDQNGAAESSEDLTIEKIAIVFNDCTQIYIRQQIIDQEQLADLCDRRDRYGT